jgi:hypothetical protein
METKVENCILSMTSYILISLIKELKKTAETKNKFIHSGIETLL